MKARTRKEKTKFVLANGLCESLAAVTVLSRAAQSSGCWSAKGEKQMIILCATFLCLLVGTFGDGDRYAF